MLRKWCISRKLFASSPCSSTTTTTTPTAARSGWFGAALLHARDFRPKPGKGKLKPRLTPEVKRTLEGRDNAAAAESEEAGKKLSRNALKRRSDRALALARMLATLTNGHIRNVIQWASLPKEVYEATRMVKWMEEAGIREGKRRQYNFLEGLIRHSRLDVLEYILQCVKSGETVALQRVLAAQEPEKEKYVKRTAERWVEGLLHNDQVVAKEVYSLPVEMFDREVLRRLVRDVRMKLLAKDKTDSESVQRSRRRCCAKSRLVLYKFLASVVKRDYNAKLASGEISAQVFPQVTLEELQTKMEAARSYSKSTAQGEQDEEEEGAESDGTSPQNSDSKGEVEGGENDDEEVEGGEDEDDEELEGSEVEGGEDEDEDDERVDEDDDDELEAEAGGSECEFTEEGPESQQSDDSGQDTDSQEEAEAEAEEDESSRLRGEIEEQRHVCLLK